MQATKKETVQKIIDSFSSTDKEAFMAFCTEDVRWAMVGMFDKTGKEAIRELMKADQDMPQDPPDIRMGNFITEGDKVVSTGTMTMKNKKGDPIDYSFCDIYTFEGEKVKEMESYVVEHKANPEHEN